MRNEQNGHVEERSVQIPVDGVTPGGGSCPPVKRQSCGALRPWQWEQPV